MADQEQIAEQTSQILKEIIPQLRDEIEKEIRDTLEKQYQDKLQEEIELMQEEAKQQIEQRMTNLQQESVNYLSDKQNQSSIHYTSFKEEIRQKITEEIAMKFAEEFEAEKRKLFAQISQQMNSSKALQQLEAKLKTKIQKENAKLLEDQKKKKLHLMRLNMQKRYEEDIILLKQEMTDTFHENLCKEQQLIQQRKEEIQLEMMGEHEKLTKIEEEKNKFKQEKSTQSNMYSQMISELQQQVNSLQMKLQKEQNEIENIRYKNQPKEQEDIYFNSNIMKSSQKQFVSPIKVKDVFQAQPPKSPYAKSLQNQIIIENQQFEKLFQNEQLFNLVDINSPPELLDSERAGKEVIETDDQEEIQQKPFKFNIQTQQSSIQQTSQGIKIFFQLLFNQVEKSDRYKEMPAKIESQQKLKEIETRKVNNGFKGSIIERLEKMCQDKLNMDGGGSISGIGGISQRTLSMQNTSKSGDLVQTKKIKKSGSLDDYEKLFQINKEDNQYNKEVKMVRQKLQKQIKEDFEMEDFYYQQVAYIKSQFLDQFKDKSMRHQIQLQSEKLIDFWSQGHVSYGERISNIQTLIDHNNPISVLDDYINQQEDLFEKGLSLIEKLSQRQKLRGEIIKENFTYEKNRRIFQSLKILGTELNNLYREYTMKYQTKFYWREVEVDQILRVDKFEQQLLEKEDLKQSIKKKIDKKFNLT